VPPSYEKRRTVILSQHIGPQQRDQLQHALASHPRQSRSDPRTASPSNPPQYAHYGPPQPARLQEHHPMDPRQLHVVDPDQLDSSRTQTMLSADYRFNPAQQAAYGPPPGEDDSRLNSMIPDSQQGFFSDFAGQQVQEGVAVALQRDSYGGPQRYSQDISSFSPSAGLAPPMLGPQDLPTASMVECMLPLEPRELPVDAFDPHNASVAMSQFDNIGAVLRHRGRTNPRQPAFWVLDSKGKEIASITFEKLASRAEKVCQVIKEKSNLYRGDRVALVYRDSEVVDFAVALLGCFLAGVVAVPMNGVEGDYAKLQLLLTTTQAHLALTTEENLKRFQRDISTRRLKWPTGVEWWKTNEFGSLTKRRDDGPQLPAPDLAYI